MAGSPSTSCSGGSELRRSADDAQRQRSRQPACHRCLAPPAAVAGQPSASRARPPQSPSGRAGAVLQLFRAAPGRRPDLPAR